MKKKLMMVLPILLILGGGFYKTKIAKPAAKPKVHVNGEVYVLPKDFLINLSDGRYAKLNAALIFKEGYVPVVSKTAGTPPDGYGTLPQEAVVRDIITDTLTDASARDLTNRKLREELKACVTKRLNANTDVKVDEVLFTDVAVQ
jgi:flagellar basal body-associated protein FliL